MRDCRPIAIFQLGQNYSAAIFVSRADGLPYVKLSRFSSSPGDDGTDFLLSATNFDALKKNREEISEALKHPDDGQTQFYCLQQQVTAYTHACRMGGEKFKKVVFDRYGVEDTRVSHFAMMKTPFLNLMEVADSISCRMCAYLKSRGGQPSKIPLALNDKTTVQSLREPRALLFTRYNPNSSTTWTYELPEKGVVRLRFWLDKINDALKTEKEDSFKLHGPHQAKVVLFKNNMYFGLGKVDAGGNRMRGEGMNMDPTSFRVLKKHMGQLIDSMYVNAGGDDVSADVEEEFSNSLTTEAPSTSTPIKAYEEEVLDQPQNGKKRPSPGSLEKDYPPSKKTKQDVEMQIPPINLYNETTDVPEAPPTPEMSFSVKAPTAPKKAKVAEPRRPVMKQFMWNWVDRNGAEIVKSPMWYFSEAECLNEAERMKPICNHPVNVNIRSQTITKPNEKVLMEKFVIYYMTTVVEACMKQHCLGCLYDSPGQKAHYEGGCLMAWEEAVDLYHDKARQAALSYPCHAWGRKLMEAMQFPINNMVAQIDDLAKSWNEDTLKNALKKVTLADDIVYLLKTCKPHE